MDKKKMRRLTANQSVAVALWLQQNAGHLTRKPATAIAETASAALGFAIAAGTVMSLARSVGLALGRTRAPAQVSERTKFAALARCVADLYQHLGVEPPEVLTHLRNNAATKTVEAASPQAPLFN